MLSATPLRLFALPLALLLPACSSGQYDYSREWRLRECEKLLYPSDVADCKKSTPHYTGQAAKN